MNFISAHRATVLGLCAFVLLFIGVSAGFLTSPASSAGRFTSRGSSASPAVDNVRILSIPTNDIIFNPVDQKIYASVPSAAGALIGNTITRIDPYTGGIGTSVFVGSEPAKMVLTGDNQAMYVHLAGAFAIRKFDFGTQAPGARFSLGQDSFSGLYTARDFVVAPDDPDLIAVARYYLGTSPPQGGVAVFRNGVRLSQTGPGHSEGAHYLAFSGSASTLYGANDYGIKTMTVSSAGVTVQSGVIPAGAYSPIKFDNGKIFTGSGQVIDPAAGTLLGTLPGANTQAFVSDASGGRAYYLVRNTSASNTWILKAYDLATFTQSGSLTIGNVQGDATSLVRWGSNGLAFRTTAGQLVLVQTALIPTDNPLPEPPPLPIPSPTPTPAYMPSFVRRLELPANDAVYSSTTNSVLVAVPGSAGTGLGNTITHVNPVNGQIQASVFIGSEPNKLALSADGQTLYAKLDGANAIRRYNAVTQSPGLQFGLSDPFLQPREIEVMPGQPDTIALTAGYNGVAVYDNGVRRPNYSSGGAYAIDSFEFSSNPNVIYGYDNQSSGFELAKLTLSAQGVAGTIIGYNLLSGYGTQIKYADGLIYATSGRVIDPESTAVSGTYQVDGFGSAIAVDAAVNRVYSLSGNVLSAFTRDTFLKIGSVTLPSFNSTPVSLSRWGTNGFLVRGFNSSTGGSEIYLIQTALVTDAAPIPTGMQLTSATASASESSPSVTLAVTRNGDVTRASSVTYSTQDGTARAGSDYVATTGTINFAAGETSANITVPILNDNVYEGNESFGLALSNPGGNNTELVSPSSATITLFDNESRPALSNLNAVVSEPPPATTRIVNVSVQLSHPSVETITVNFATSNGTATAGSDYLATSGTLTFTPLEMVKTIPVQILGDTIAENNETFLINLSGPVNASISVGQAVVTIQNFSSRAPFDFDGDRKTDIGIYRPSVGGAEWWINRSSNSSTLALQFGAQSDRPAPADYSGDGKVDIAFFRPASGEWFVLRSEDFSFFAAPFGASGDAPVPADYDADGRADFAVFRPSSSTWFISQSSGAPTRIEQFGISSDQPVVADYDGDGKADVGILRPAASGAEWWIARSTAGSLAMQFGSPTDKAVQGDYTGDGKTDIAIWRPSTGEWFIVRSEDSSFYGFPFGASGDVPAPGDYDGDGKFDPTVFRPASATWFIARTTAGTQIVQFGATGDRPIPNAFVP